MNKVWQPSPYMLFLSLNEIRVRTVVIFDLSGLPCGVFQDVQTQKGS